MTRRAALLVISAVWLLGTLGTTTAVMAQDGTGETHTLEGDSNQIDIGQDDTDEIPAQCRTIIGCPDAGPEPENPGDRGGYAQLLTLAVLAVGIGFIMTKVFRAARASQPDPVE